MTVAYNMDCMEAMRQMPDKAFELAIVDPPYGQYGSTLNFRHEGKFYANVVPQDEYWKLLFRVSVNQVVWGGNYFSLPISRGWVFWNKHQPLDRFSDGELAWTSFNKVLKTYDYPYTNVMEGEGARKEKAIHPTQKPVALYEWLLTHYAKPGDRILDTHLGSGSSRIAAYNLGFDFVGYEIDKDYFDAQEERFKAHTAQVNLFVG